MQTNRTKVNKGDTEAEERRGRAHTACLSHVSKGTHIQTHMHQSTHLYITRGIKNTNNLIWTCKLPKVSVSKRGH